MGLFIPLTTQHARRRLPAMAELPAPTVPSAAEPASTPASPPKLSSTQPPRSLDWEGSELELPKADPAEPQVVFRLKIAPSVMDGRVTDYEAGHPLSWD